MKRCRNLNQSLQKRLLWLLALQSDTFPVLVSEEKLLVLVASQTFRKGPATPVKWHRSHIIIQRLTIPSASLEWETAPSGAVSVAGEARDSGV